MFPSTDIGAVQAQADVLMTLTGRLAPDAVPLPEAPRLWQAFDRIERLAAGAKLLLGRRVDESAVWQQAGDRDAGVWMARHQGSSVTAARIGLATSKRLAKLSDTAAALRRGELSVPQVEPIADAASHDTDAEMRLLRLAADANLGELREECGRVKAKADPDPEARHRRIHANRRLRQGTNSDGAWSLWGTGPVEDGGELNAVLGPIVDEIFHEARGEGREESREAYRWDALIEMARRAHELVYNPVDIEDMDDDIDDTEATDGHDPGRDHGDAGDNVDSTPDDDVDNSDAGCTGSDRDSGVKALDAALESAATARGRNPRVGKARRSRRARMNEKYLGLLRVDLEALARGEIEDGEVCEIGGVPVAVSVARQVLGNAVLKLVITRGDDVMSVTHLGRGPTAAQKVALRWMSPTCTVLGCNRTDLQHDHRIDWATTHHTRLDQLDDICTHHHDLKTRNHHDLKTRKGWALVSGKGKRAMVPSSDPRHPRHNRSRSEPQAVAA